MSLDESVATVTSVPSPDLDYKERGECILIAKRDEDRRRTLADQIKSEGYCVREAGDMRSAVEALSRGDIAVAVVGVALEGGYPLQLVRELAATQIIAVIVVSELGDPDQRAEGIEAGADDYLVMPYEPRELYARIKRQLARIRHVRKSAKRPNSLAYLKFGPWLINPQARAVTTEDGKAAHLSDTEFKTLHCLVKERGRIVSRDEIHSYVTGAAERDPLDRSVDIHVASIRKKLQVPGDTLIRTVHRQGYVVD